MKFHDQFEQFFGIIIAKKKIIKIYSIQTTLDKNENGKTKHDFILIILFLFHILLISFLFERNLR
jgi:hypothetical protein